MLQSILELASSLEVKNLYLGSIYLDGIVMVRDCPSQVFLLDVEFASAEPFTPRSPGARQTSATMCNSIKLQACIVDATCRALAGVDNSVSHEAAGGMRSLMYGQPVHRWHRA